MYNGYYMKIDGVTFPQKYIAKGSYKGNESEREVETWLDAAKVEHKIVTGTKKATISFSIVEHDSDEHGTIVAFFSKYDNYSVNFYSDCSDAYRTANCRLDKIEWPRRSSYGGKIQYAAAKVTFVEN